jgi:2,3-bisphosphoglycerate-dependent phosphoglycerate mutase
VPGKLLLVRHGQSTWNLENLFTGWTDVDLSPQGVEEARQAGVEIARAGLAPEFVVTSVLKRAIRTQWLILEQLDLLWLPVLRDWRMNERHYGALQGLNKAQTTASYGEAQVRIWRRSFDIAPPPLAADDARHPRFDRRYAGVAAAELPATESLKDTLARVVPCWEQCIAPQLRANRQVMVVAHGNSLRALVMMLDRLSPSAIVELNIPTGIPLLYELDDSLRPISSRYLGDAAAVAAAADAVRRQGEVRP